MEDLLGTQLSENVIPQAHSADCTTLPRSLRVLTYIAVDLTEHPHTDKKLGKAWATHSLWGKEFRKDIAEYDNAYLAIEVQRSFLVILKD